MIFWQIVISEDYFYHLYFTALYFSLSAPQILTQDLHRYISTISSKSNFSLACGVGYFLRIIIGYLLLIFIFLNFFFLIHSFNLTIFLISFMTLVGALAATLESHHRPLLRRAGLNY